MAWRESVAFGKVRADEVSVKTLKTGGDPLNGTAATEVTATGAELNQLDGVIISTGVAGGAGFEGVASLLENKVTKMGSLFKTEIIFDLTGLTSSATDGDIIGDEGTGAAYFTQITAAKNGTVFGGKVTCLEAPSTGDDDIAIYSAVEGTGVEDTAITALDETLLLDHGAWTLGQVDAALVAMPGADEYLYLVCKGGDTAGNYDGGKFLIELYGV